MQQLTLDITIPNVISRKVKEPKINNRLKKAIKREESINKNIKKNIREQDSEYSQLKLI